MLKYAVLFFLLILSTTMGYSQRMEPQHRVLSTEDGLSSSGTDIFLMDRNDIMWMSGGRGLDKFDGLRVVNFSFENGVLMSNAISEIAEDFEGKLWLLTDRITASSQFDLQIFDPKQKSSAWLSDYLPGSELVSKSIWSIINDPWHQEVWLISGKDIYIYNAEGFRKIYSSPNDIAQTAIAPQGIWIKQGDQFELVNLQGEIVNQFETEEKGDYKFVGVDSESNLYHYQIRDREALDKSQIFKNDSLFTIDGKYVWAYAILLGLNTNEDLTVSREAYDYVLRDMDQNEVSRVLPEIDFYTFPFDIYFDHYNNWWRYFNKEVHVFNVRKPRFQNYLKDFFIFGETGFNARGIALLNDSTLLINGLGGTYLVDSRTGEKEELPIPYELWRGSYLTNYRRLELSPFSPNELLISTEGGLLFKYDFVEKAYSRIVSEQVQIEGQEITQENTDMNWVIKEFNDIFYIGQGAGLSTFKRGDQIYRKFSDYNEFKELANTSIYDIYEKSGDIWLGTEIGLYRLTPGKGITKKVDLANTKVGLNPSIRHINSFDEKTLHLATQAGVVEYDLTSDQVLNLWNVSTGMSDNMSYAVYQDRLKRLWIPTDDGINLVNSTKGQVKVFRKSDGIPNNEFNTTSHLQDRNGVLYFGNINGVTRLDPLDFPEDDQVDGLFLSSIRLQQGKDGKFIDYDNDINTMQELTMHPKHVSLELKFGLRDYINPTLNSFSYKLEGLDNEWTFINSAEIRINRLPYGKHTLLVRAQGSYGTNYSMKSYVLHVLRPFYLTWWFIVSVIVVLSIAIVKIVRYREKLLKQRQKQLEQDIESATEEIRQQADELRSLDELKSNFFANTSHELKTPLSLILAPLEKAIQQEELTSDTKSNLQLAKRNTETIKSLVDEILDLSRLENGIAQPRYAKVFINSYFGNLTSNFNPKADGQEIRLTFESDFEEEESWVLDTAMTDKIINNLLSNALKFTPTGGEIKVKIKNEDGLIAEVIDTGEGISDRDQPYIFDRFFQTKDPKKKTDGGTGIGLALSYELASVMNGQLSVESEIAKGSKFTLWLPEVPEPEFSINTLNKEEAEIYPNIVFENKKILLVEDNEDLSTFIRINLQEQFEVFTSKDGLKAIDFLNSEDGEQIDLIISDMMMPNLDGLGLLKEIKSNENWTHIPIVFLTARSAERDKLEAFRLGVDDYLLKPFSLEELKARIKNQLKVNHLKKLEDQKNSANEHSSPEFTLEDKWLVRVREQTEQHIAAVDFNIALLAEKMGESERTFYRKLKSATGYSPNTYIKEIRLQMSRTYLEYGAFETLTDVANAIGFTSVEYFSKQYKERFGKLPSEYFRYV